MITVFLTSLPSPFGKWLRVALLASVLSVAANSETSAQNALRPSGANEFGWIVLSGSVPEDPAGEHLYEVYRSIDLVDWQRVASVHHWPFRYADPLSAVDPAGYFRLSTRRKLKDDDWKNIAVIPRAIEGRYLDDPFFVYPVNRAADGPAWMKFAIVRESPEQVIFQDSRAYPFHYDFADERLEGFKGLTRQQFDEVSLYPGENHKIVLGAILSGHGFGSDEIGIQIVGREPFARANIAQWFHLIRTTVNAPDHAPFLYMPTYEQSGLSGDDLNYFESIGITVASPDRWLPGDGVYSTLR